MKPVIDYVEEAKEKLGLDSDAALAKHIGGGRSLISQWRNDGKVPDDYYCIRLGEVLGIDPLEVIASANYEREKSSDKKEWWSDFMKRHGSKVGTVLLGCALTYSYCGLHGQEKSHEIMALALTNIQIHSGNNLYIM